MALPHPHPRRVGRGDVRDGHRDHRRGGVNPRLSGSLERQTPGSQHFGTTITSFCPYRDGLWSGELNDVFVQYYGMVERPFSEVETDLLSIGDALAESADVAYRHGEGLLVRIGGGSMAKTVMLDLRTPVRGASTTTLPLEWWATGTPALFPRMEAELIVADMGGSLTQVLFQGNYQPPLGSVGRMLDRAVLHRFAEVSVKDFVDRIIEVLSDSAVG